MEHKYKHATSMVPIDGFPKTVFHPWEKKSIVSECDDDGVYDIYWCPRCGTTGRRYGFSSSIHVKYAKEVRCKNVKNKNDLMYEG